MTLKKHVTITRPTVLLASSRFFWVLVALIVAQALWIACTGRYPMAFDEDFHLGIIRLYAHHPWPFWTAQPAHANAFGAVYRDPSYLYQYLMSFPYRLISLFTHDQTIQVLFLRFINIALFASGLPLFRKLLLRTGASRSIVHACFAIFALVPIVPLLAAQINYDNLMLPYIALTLLATVRFSDQLKRDKHVPLVMLTQVVCLCLLGSLIKYAFLPILLAIFIFCVVRLRQAFGAYRAVLAALWKAIITATLRTRLLVGGALIICLLLFGERYGINMVRYHSPIPDCGKVLSTKACSAYGPWIRDYNFSLNKVAPAATKSPIAYSADWVYGMWLRSFFAVDGPASDFQTRGPFPLPALSVVVIACIALVAFVVRGKRVWRVYDATVLWLLASVTILYGVALWLDDYREFLHTGQPVAINGRYLLLILLPVLLMSALSIKELLRTKQKLPVAMFCILLLCMLWGGGALTYILRSNDAWYWPAQPVYDANHAVQTLLKPVVPGTQTPTEFMH